MHSPPMPAVSSSHGLHCPVPFRDLTRLPSAHLLKDMRSGVDTASGSQWWQQLCAETPKLELNLPDGQGLQEA